MVALLTYVGKHPTVLLEIAGLVFAVWLINRERTRSSWFLVGVLALVAGSGLLTWGLWSTLFPTTSQYLAEHGHSAIATITKITKSSTDASGSRMVLAADVRYDTPKGSVTTNLDLSNSVEQLMKSKVLVLYDPAKPTTAMPLDIPSAPNGYYETPLKVLGVGDLAISTVILSALIITKRRRASVNADVQHQQ
ncbi:DUF3592 domain-containing protein [Actinoallomurus sp. NPDC050550]|uniref:DUF3592 domain-containing protein n=1 Tax=Actinoallomurus sp. NPDC050550 TaxID=3154937 RepID=UPI0033C3D784